jgi:uncharacterized protein (TIGR03083 family)
VTGPVQRAYVQAAGFFVDVTARVRPEQWDQPGLGVWTVRDLVGHTTRALSTVEGYLGKPSGKARIATAADYFDASRSRGPQDDPGEIAQRGRAAGAALGADPLQTVRGIADRILEMVASTDPEAVVGTRAGDMTLEAYLPTRVFELIVHTLDLATAIGVQVDPPREPLTMVYEVVAELAARSGQGGETLLALTGRRPLPEGFSVLRL